MCVVMVLPYLVCTFVCVREVLMWVGARGRVWYAVFGWESEYIRVCTMFYIVVQRVVLGEDTFMIFISKTSPP